MSTEATSGQLPEQRSEPMAEAGCEDKIDRNVQGTVAATGSAPHRSRASIIKDEAELYERLAIRSDDWDTADAWRDVYDAAADLIEMLDGRSNAEDETW